MSSSAVEVVKMTTGILFRLGSSLISSRTSRPPFLGRFRSNRIRSGRGALACFPCRHRKDVASIPSEATCRVLHLGVSQGLLSEPYIAGAVFHQENLYG